MRKTITYIVLFAIFFAASWSLFRNDFFYVHDFTQGARIVEMQQALFDGHFPVRWSSNLGFGYGMPLFEFYAPLPYYVSSLFYTLGLSLVNSIKSLFIISTLGTLLGGYWLGKKMFGYEWGLVTAALITLAPYRAVNLFVRGAVSEAWGIMALPFILLGLIQVIRKEKYGWIVLTLSITTLLLSHNLTSLIFLPFSILFGLAYLILYIKEKKRSFSDFIKASFSLAGIYFLAVLISSFYLIPALLEKDFTRLESAILTDYFDYNLHFLYIRQFFQLNWKYGGSTYGPSDDISFFLGLGQLLALLLSGILFIKYFIVNLISKKKLTLRKFIALFDRDVVMYLVSLLLMLTALLMSLGRSKIVWDAIEFLSFIQFPWRWLSVAIVFLAVVAGFSSKFINSSKFSNIFAGTIIAVTLASSWFMFRPEEFLSDTSEYYYSDEAQIRSEMSETLPDFISVQVEEDIIKPVAPIGSILACEIDKSCQFEFDKVVDKTHRKTVQIDSKEDTTIEFAVLDFPGWVVKVDGNEIEYNQSELGTIVVALSEGLNEVTLEFRNTQIRSMADFLSVVGLVVFLSLILWYHGGSKHRKKMKNK